MMSEEPVLRPEEVASVLADEENASPDLPAEGPQPYSLREPVAIPANAEGVAAERMERVVATFDRMLGTESDDGIKLTVEGLQQQRAAAALSVLPGPVWVAGLAADSGGGIALALQPAVAIALVERALGGEGAPPAEGREPTGLEARVLSRLLAKVAAEAGAILGVTLNPLGLEIGRVPDRIAAAGETVGVGPLRFAIGDTDHTSLLLASASLLLPPATVSASASTSPGPLARRLERVVAPVRPVLPAGRISMAELIALEPGSLLKFDIAEDSPLSLRVGATRVATGRVLREEDATVFKVESRVGQEPTEEPS